MYHRYLCCLQFLFSLKNSVVRRKHEIHRISSISFLRKLNTWTTFLKEAFRVSLSGIMHTSKVQLSSRLAKLINFPTTMQKHKLDEVESVTFLLYFLSSTFYVSILFYFFSFCNIVYCSINIHQHHCWKFDWKT